MMITLGMNFMKKHAIMIQKQQYILHNKTVKHIAIFNEGCCFRSHSIGIRRQLKIRTCDLSVHVKNSMSQDELSCKAVLKL